MDVKERGFSIHVDSKIKEFDTHVEAKKQDFNATADKALPDVNQSLGRLEEFDDQLREGSFRLATLRVGHLKIEGGYLGVYDPNGKERVTVGVSTDGNGGIWLTSKQDHEGVRLIATQDNGQLFLKNRSGKTIVNLGSNDSGDGDLRLYDSKGETTCSGWSFNEGERDSFGNRKNRERENILNPIAQSVSTLRATD